MLARLREHKQEAQLVRLYRVVREIEKNSLKDSCQAQNTSHNRASTLQPALQNVIEIGISGCFQVLTQLTRVVKNTATKKQINSSSKLAEITPRAQMEKFFS